MELITGTTTEGMNGYPKNLKEFVYGFETFEEAENYALENNKVVCLFKRREGHGFFENKGIVYKSLDIYDYLSDLGDDYSIFDFKQEKQALSERLLETDYPDDVLMLIKSFKELLDEQDSLEDGEMIITYQGDYYETCDEKLMSYSEDVYTYLIGV